MNFYCGMHHPSKAGSLERAFISVHALKGRRSDFAVNDWILDSGAFSTIDREGGYPEPPEAYAAQVNRWSSVGQMERAVSQDYMCEPWMLERCRETTGGTVEAHQRLTIERYDALFALCGPILMPVLQGWLPADYARHALAYGERLTPGAWVGIGSVCKRQGRPGAIAAVLDAVLDVRPDLLLHGFGVKIGAIGDSSVRSRLHSCDSMAWSFAARRQGRDGNSLAEALAYVHKVETMPVQESWL